MRLKVGERRHSGRTAIGWVVWMICLAGASSPSDTFGDDPQRTTDSSSDPTAAEFFEKTIRPLLATRCQGCHGLAKQKGGLRLDSRAAVLAGGSSGPAVVPGDPKASAIIEAINYGEDVQMPPKSKLPDQEIAAMTRWVRMGAPWGADVPAAASPKAGSTDFEPILRERARFWSFQPLRRNAPPSPSTSPGWCGTRSIDSSSTD